jgi:hypothetical protein
MGEKAGKRLVNIKTIFTIKRKFKSVLRDDIFLINITLLQIFGDTKIRLSYHLILTDLFDCEK